MTTCPYREQCWEAVLNWWDGEHDEAEPCWHELENRIGDCSNFAFFKREADGEDVDYYVVEVM